MPAEGRGIDLLAGRTAPRRDVVAFLGAGQIHIFDMAAGTVESRNAGLAGDRPLTFGDRHKENPHLTRSPRLLDEISGRAAMLVGSDDENGLFWLGQPHQSREAGISPLPAHALNQPAGLSLDEAGRCILWSYEDGDLQGQHIGSRNSDWNELRGVKVMATLPAPSLLKNQLLRLDHHGAQGWRLEVLGTAPLNLLSLASFFLDCDQTRDESPCPRFMPPLAVHNFGMLVAIVREGHVGVLACRA